MLYQMEPIPGTDKALRKQLTAQALERLSAQQLPIRENKLPVIVLIEGWSAAGKGSLISKLIRDLDPRFYNVISFDNPTETESRRPWLWRYFTHIPEYGKLEFLDSGWVEQTMRDRVSGRLDKNQFQKRLDSIKRFERQLCDDGYLVVRFFLNISRKEQKRRINRLLDNKDTMWRVSEFDRWQNEHYKECEAVYDEILEATQS